MSWLDDYIDYTKSQEAPEIFHRWTGITTIASVLSRKVWLPRISADGFEYVRTRPGMMMVVLVAGSGAMRKSTAIDLGEELMRDAGVRLFTGKITPERLLAKLGSFEDAKAVMTIIASELSVLLSKQQYAEPMINILTKLSDGKDDEYETQKTKPITLKDVCVTMLMATTPIGLGKSIPEEAHEHGFRSRFVFVYSEDNRKSESLGKREEDIDENIKREVMAKKAKLVMRLREYSKLRGPFRWEPAANKWFNDWYDAYHQSEEGKGIGWPSRRADHMLRTALVLSVSDHNITDYSQLVLYKDSLLKADKYLKEVEAGFDKAFAEIGKHSSADIQRRIIGCFRNGSKVTDEDIYFACIGYVEGRNLQQIIESMRIAGMIRMQTFDASTNLRTWVLNKEKLGL